MEPTALTRFIVDECRGLGFARVGVMAVESAARFHLYEEWVQAGRAGEMTYLVEPEAREARRDVRSLLRTARTVVVVGLSYAGGGPGPVARYARGPDYHIVMKQRLGALVTRIASVVGQPLGARSCVDTAPVLERDLAERSGVGFGAKNTMIIAPGVGSYLLLGELLLDVEAAPTAEEPERKRCGACRLCLDACPTGAFVDEHVLDARRCISYLTIELMGPMPRELRALVGVRIFGCDVCQEVCPFNAAARTGDPEMTDVRPKLAAPDLIAMLDVGASQYRALVKRTALRRLHRPQLLRNVCVALGNAGDAAAIPGLRRLLAREGPLVRAHAVWALGRLGDVDHLRGLSDDDQAVREEITAAVEGRA